MLVAGNYGAFRTKKIFREKCVGRIAALVVVETSLFGNELSANGTFPVVGPRAAERKWYATITVQEGIITAVK